MLSSTMNAPPSLLPSNPLLLSSLVKELNSGRTHNAKTWRLRLLIRKGGWQG